MCFISLIEILNPMLEISFIETHIVGRKTGKNIHRNEAKRFKDDTVMLLEKKMREERIPRTVSYKFNSK